MKQSPSSKNLIVISLAVLFLLLATGTSGVLNPDYIRHIGQASAVLETATTTTSTPNHLDGLGRPNVQLANEAGECQANGLKISRALPVVQWGNAASACPQNWWVCTAAERGEGGCKDLTFSEPRVIDCRPDLEKPLVEIGGETSAWVADAYVDAITGVVRGMAIDAANSDIVSAINLCSTRSVWCCATIIKS